MSITQKPAHSLLTINLLLSASLLTLAVAHMMNLLSTATGLLLVLPVLAVGIPAFTLLLRLLTMIEDRGIRFFGKQRGWRITREVSGAVCAHASIGWVIGGILVFTALSLNFGQTWGSGAGLIRRVTGLMYYVQWVPVAALGFFAGMLVFEILVYVGVRECRFANPPRRGNT